MLRLLSLLTLALGLLLPSSAFAFQKDEPDPAKQAHERKVAQALARIDTALKGDKVNEQVYALQSAAEVVDERVVLRVGKLLTHKRSEVSRAAIETLGVMHTGDSLELLHRHEKKQRKKLVKDPELYVLVFKAIGRHGNPDSIPVLADNAFSQRNATVIMSRLMGLANIRTDESLAAVFHLMTKVDRRKVQGQMRNFRTALVRLTGVDKGVNQQAWLDWWAANKRTFEVAAKAPKMTQRMVQRWDAYWGNQRQYQRNKKRKDRGQDDDGD